MDGTNASTCMYACMYLPKNEQSLLLLIKPPESIYTRAEQAISSNGIENSHVVYDSIILLLYGHPVC